MNSVEKFVLLYTIFIIVIGILTILHLLGFVIPIFEYTQSNLTSNITSNDTNYVPVIYVPMYP